MRNLLYILFFFLCICLFGCDQKVNVEVPEDNLDVLTDNRITAKAEINSHLTLTNYSEANQSLILYCLEHASNIIETANTKEDIEFAVSEFKEKVALLLTESKESLKIAKEIGTAIVVSYIELADYSETNQTLINEAINNSISLIESLDSIDEINEKVSEVKKQLAEFVTLEEEHLKLVQAAAVDELFLFPKYENYNETNQNIIREILKESIIKIYNCSTVGKVTEELNSSKNLIEEVVTIDEEWETNASTFKENIDGKYNSNPFFSDSYVTTSGSSVIVDTEYEDYVEFRFGNQNNNVNVVLDTYLTINFRNVNYSSATICFRAWDSNTNYKMEITSTMIKFYKSTWDGETSSKKETLLREVVMDTKNREKFHLQILCLEWQKTVLIDGKAIFSISEGDNCTGYTYVSAWQSGLVFEKPQYIEYDNREQLLEKYGDVIWQTPEYVTYPVDLDVVSGGFVNENGATKSSKENNVALVRATDMIEGTFTAKIKSGLNSSVGLIFGLSESDSNYSYYRFVSNGSRGVVAVEKVVNGVVEVIYSNYLSAGYTVNSEFTYRVVIVDGKAYCYFWKTLYYVLDLELTGTKIGIYAEKSGARFVDYNLSESVEYDTVDTLLFGHSYFEMWSSYKEDLSTLANTYDFGEYLNIGIGGSVASNWKNFKESLATYNASKVIYMIGTNDLAVGIDPEDIVSDIEETLTYMKSVKSELLVVLLSINNCPMRANLAPKVTDTNDLMEALCEKYEWMSYAEVENAFSDDGVNPDSHWFIDELHPTHAGYTEKIVPAIEIAFKKFK